MTRRAHVTPPRDPAALLKPSHLALPQEAQAGDGPLRKHMTEEGAPAWRQKWLKALAKLGT